MGSKANGSLMRASPLGIWGWRLAPDALACLAQREAALSHPNPCCTHAAACYVAAISHLLGSPGDRSGACDQVWQWADVHATGEVTGWLHDAAANVDVPYEPQIGFVKIAFTHAFRHLLLGTSYVDAIRETLLGGGDTDTNACIVGGLLGAACGVESIPEEMRSAVLNCNTEVGHSRPAFLHARRAPKSVDELLLHAARVEQKDGHERTIREMS